MAKNCSVKKKIMQDGRETIVCDETRAELLPSLQKIQKEQGYISDEDMQKLADEFNIHPVEVYSVVTFYVFLKTKKQGTCHIRVSTCPSCECAGSEKVIEALEKELGITAGETTSSGEFSLEKASCIGMCDHAPAIMVGEKLVGNVTPEKVAKLIEECRSGKSPLTGEYEVGSVKREGEILLREVEPYAALKKSLSSGRVFVLEEIRDSGIKGRGGAGFPTGVKWNLAAAAQSDNKYVVCNADEGEPGTFKDRILLSEYAKTVFEGMAIAAFAIGAGKGILYMRGEYESFLPKLENILEEMRKEGAIGKDIFGKGFNFDIEIKLGSGAYVCGEETALIESLEGNRGEPRNRPPFPVNTGYMGDPTVVNNVETCVAVVHIIDGGSEWFKKTGTEKSVGTKLISVSGDCEKPGVYEIRFGTGIDQILEMAGAKNPKAVQIGGASGVCVSKKDFNRKISFEDIPTGGAVIIFGKDRNMIDMAGNFLKFFEEESCGQCTPCREGIPVLLEIWQKAREKGLSDKDKEKLYSLAETMQLASKCGLGQTSANAFLSIVENFS
jgi:[NiFe] hydrogenase diaphorase moiety large subunit